jgi:undecaprenyl-diphosphatase
MVVLCALLYRRGRSTDAVVVAVITLGATGMANLDKVLVGRPRPPVHHLEAVASASFPSGHATQASAFYLSALLILLAGRPPRALAIAAALATAALVAGVALSRVYLGVHYPSDVAGGLLLGATWSVLVRRATDHWGARGPVNVASEMRLSCAEAEPR